MAEKIHYDDNFFFITAMIRALDAATSLNIDAEYFADKVIEDTLFIDSTIQKLYASLTENKHLIRRKIHLSSIMKLKKVYCRLLDNLLALKGTSAMPTDFQRPKLKSIASTHLNEVQEIHELINGIHTARFDSDEISHSELQMLMSSMDDEGET